VFGGGQRCARVGNAGFEAVFVDFLQVGGNPSLVRLI
jgi:hypothetical protein